MYNKFDNFIQAGRVVNDISIDDLANDYKRKIFDLISLLKYKTVVLDFDGTMDEFKYDKKRLLPCKDDDLYEYSKKENIYENARILKTMQYILIGR